MSADYLIAADGANSRIRTALGVGRSGHGHIAEHLDLFPRGPFFGDEKSGVRAVSDRKPEVAGTLWPIDGAERWAFSTTGATQRDDSTDEAGSIRLHKGLGIAGVDVEIIDQSTWESAMRVADRFSQGYKFLAGAQPMSCRLWQRPAPTQPSSVLVRPDGESSRGIPRGMSPCPTEFGWVLGQRR
ncbi:MULTISPECIES: FAD-dependent monooxygenase [unclassified Caballeronia]|uniref:FAD-dependent monooxygenase n=1 Tax=unclassified Caballeronia TaxID=2646786 RepID=UPI002028E6A2|nr:MULTISPECIES: FAD-dependent monooxygenase [unclassified Caballeronia]